MTEHAKFIKEARRELGLSTKGLARALRMGDNAGRTVRHWEAGDYEPSGPVLVAIEFMLATSKTDPSALDK